MSWISVGASPHRPVFTPDGQIALVVVQDPGALKFLDRSSSTLLRTVFVGKGPHWIATNSNGRFAYVTDEGSDDVAVVDLAGHAVVARIPIGNAPRTIAVQPEQAVVALYRVVNQPIKAIEGPDVR